AEIPLLGPLRIRHLAQPTPAARRPAGPLRSHAGDPRPRGELPLAIGSHRGGREEGGEPSARQARLTTLPDDGRVHRICDRVEAEVEVEVEVEVIKEEKLMASVPAPRAVIETRFGEMEIELLPDKAPGHVKNFTDLVRKGF